MPFFFEQNDVTTRYGEKEIIELTDRTQNQTEVINVPLLESKMDDAENELIQELNCCYDIKAIKAFYSENPGNKIPVFTTWLCKITRKNLYDSIRLNINSGEIDHQAMREYKEVLEQIRKACDCGVLFDSNDDLVPKRSVFAMKEDKSCVQYQCPCPDEEIIT